MFRGRCILRCDNCGKVFRDMDIELIATVFTAPQKCPRCGSMHTMPLFLPFYRPFYKKIWKDIDKTNQT